MLAVFWMEQSSWPCLLFSYRVLDVLSSLVKANKAVVPELYKFGTFEFLLWKLIAGDITADDRLRIVKFLSRTHLHQVGLRRQWQLGNLRGCPRWGMSPHTTVHSVTDTHDQLGYLLHQSSTDAGLSALPLSLSGARCSLSRVCQGPRGCGAPALARQHPAALPAAGPRGKAHSRGERVNRDPV